MGVTKRLLALVLLIAVLGLDRTSVVRNAAYHATYAPTSGSMTGPFSGDMTLTFNRGAISGNYNDTSKLAQAPLFGQKNVAVIGNIDTESNVRMHIGPLAIVGKVTGNMITGTLTYSGRNYNFRANPTQ